MRARLPLQRIHGSEMGRAGTHFVWGLWLDMRNLPKRVFGYAEVSTAGPNGHFDASRPRKPRGRA